MSLLLGLTLAPQEMPQSVVPMQPQLPQRLRCTYIVVLSVCNQQQQVMFWVWYKRLVVQEKYSCQSYCHPPIAAAGATQVRTVPSSEAEARR